MSNTPKDALIERTVSSIIRQHQNNGWMADKMIAAFRKEAAMCTSTMQVVRVADKYLSAKK